MPAISTSRPRLPATVVALGLTSFFTDLGAEMIVPLLPLWLAGLGAGPAFLGMIEGAADAVAASIKLISGIWADRMGRDKPWVVGGYALATLVRPLVALSSSPWQVLAVRLSDRVGKGLRTAPRDAMLARSVPATELTRAFGVQRAWDHAGALLGPLVASALLFAGLGLQQVFWLAAIPGVLAVLCASLAPEPLRPPIVQAPDVAAAAINRSVSPRLRHFLVICGFFALGNSSDVFLILRARELGLPDTALPLVWSLLNASKMIAALFAGHLVRPNRRGQSIAVGWMIYAFSYLGFATPADPWLFWLLIAIYGIFHGLTEPAERALVKELVQTNDAGRAYGWYNAIPGWLALPAAALTGLLWEFGGAALAFGVSAIMAIASAILIWWTFVRGAITKPEPGDANNVDDRNGPTAAN